MATVKIYRFRTWDSHGDQIKEARRWGTREAILGAIGGQIIEGSEFEVDESQVDGDGLTPINVDPTRKGGFQTWKPS